MVNIENELLKITLGGIIKWSSVALVSLSTIIQISPIKFNPWTELAKLIGNAINKEMIEKIDKLEKNIDNISHKVDSNEIKRLRSEILSFSNSCKVGKKHTRDEFEHIIESHDDYEKLISDTGSRNGLIDVEYEYIVEIYKECLQKGTLL